MKVALVHEYLTNFAGSEQVLLAFQELFPEAPIFTAIHDPEQCPQFNKADIRTSFLQKWPGAKRYYKYYIPLLPLAVESYDLSQYDLVISDCHIAAKGVITKPDTVHICYCHTPIRYAWSPEVDPRGSKSWLARLASHYLRIWDVLAARRVDHWIANSGYIAARIKKYYRASATVIHPPVDIKALPFDSSAPIEDYYILFGRLIDYKRPDLAIEAFNQLGKRLIVVGRGPMLKQLQKMAKPNIEFRTEFLPYNAIAKLFASAAAMIFPVEEDFGLAMVDMLACGRPVIAYNVGGARDIIKPGLTGEFFSQQSAAAIKKVVADFDPMRYDRKAIRAIAMSFDRQLFKDKIMSYIESVTGERLK